MVHLLSAFLLTSSLALPAQDDATTKLVRPCAATWNAPPADPKKKQPTRKPKQEIQADPGVCIELAYPQLDIQEFLQARARKEQWKIFEERVTEETWSFSIELTKEELLKSTADSKLAGRVEWTKGIALVTVTTFPLPDGFSRTIIRAGFRGYAKAVDQFLAEREYWELESNHTLEGTMIAALENYIKTAPPRVQDSAEPTDK
jgi:hypothetical protein